MDVAVNQGLYLKFEGLYMYATEKSSYKDIFKIKT